MVLEINTKNFEELMRSDKPLIIDFGAEWCSPCKALAPIIEELDCEFGDQINIGKCNVEENIELCEQFEIKNVPTVVFINDGRLQDILIGATTKAILTEKLMTLLR